MAVATLRQKSRLQVITASMSLLNVDPHDPGYRSFIWRQAPLRSHLH